jgi:hypothetical protein
VLTVDRADYARLLRLGAGVDLDEEPRPAVLRRHLLRQRRGDLVAVDRLDDVEQLNRLLRLVGLQRPDEMQLDVGMVRLEVRPLPRRLLHPVLAEHAVAGVEHRRYIGLPEGLRHGNQPDSAGRAAGRHRRCL